MKNSTFDPQQHINYNHFVGEVVRAPRYYDRSEDGESNFCLFTLKVQTSYMGNEHPPLYVEFIVWDKLADNIGTFDLQPGDILNVEGRLTIRTVRGVVRYSITGNKVGIVRSIEGKEPFIENIPNK